MATIKNPVHAYVSEEASASVSLIESLNAIITETSAEAETLRVSIVKGVTDDMINALIEDDEVRGTYQMAVQKDVHQGADIQLSVATGKLTDTEVDLLDRLTPSVRNALFVTSKEPTSISSVDAIVTHITAMDHAARLKFFKIKSGKLIIDPLGDIPGVDSVEIETPVTSFFGNLEVALKNSTARDTDTKIMAEWLGERVKGALKMNAK